MAWYERDYAKRPPPPGRSFQMPTLTSIVKWLMIINVAVFVLDGILTRAMGHIALTTPEGFYQIRQLEQWGYFSVDTAILKFQVWRILTFQFLHGSIGHLLGNMIGLFFFGPIIERYLGSRRFLAFYLLCGFAGTIAYIGFWGSGLILGDAGVPMVGASAGVFGVLIGTARVAPNITVWVMLMFPLQMRTLAWIIVGIAAYTVIARGNEMGANAGGEAAHLGGAALGFLLIKHVEWLNFAMWRPGKKTGRQISPRRKERDEKEIDRILKKVRDKGLQSLSETEKSTLQNATDNRRAG